MEKEEGTDFVEVEFAYENDDNNDEAAKPEEDLDRGSVPMGVVVGMVVMDGII